VRSRPEPLLAFVFPVELVAEGDDRRIAQPADLEELAGLLLDALGRARYHDRALDRGQGAIGVLAEILVARRVEQVEGEPPCSKLITAEETKMQRSRSTAIQYEHTRRRSSRSRR
jgi:hypothetical protein